MNKLNRFIIIFTFFLFSCKNSVIQKTNYTQSLDNLDMTIYSKKGEKLYTIKTPNSKYNEDKIFYLEKTNISLFENKD